MTNQSPHNVDFLLWYAGQAVELKAYWANVNHPYVEIEDNAVTILKFKSGGLGIIKGTVSMNPPRRIHGVTLVGESGPDREPGLLGDRPGATEDQERNRATSGRTTSGRFPASTARRQDEAIDYGSGDLPNSTPTSCGT
jgi:predicted dehydrogenase